MFYARAALIYHSLYNLIMRLSLTFSSVRYLPPINPGGAYKSQYGQDFYLEKLGLIKPGGFFVEIGCNHPVHNSNSHYLEKELDWHGISVDGIDYSELYRELRPNTQFINSLVSDVEQTLDFHVVRDVEGWENQVSSIHKETLGMGKTFEADVVKMETKRFNSLVPATQTVDLCLIDVEGHEFEVLKSINFDQAPSVLVVENSGQFYSRSSLVKFLVEIGYVHIARIGTSDDIFVWESSTKGIV